jgi:hypothetical protein
MKVSIVSQNPKIEHSYITKKTIMPTSEKLINAPAGPPSDKAFPELTSKPGPIIPARKYH